MSVLLPLLLLVIFIAIVASLYTEGMWGNALMLINVVTAALLATNFFEPLAGWLESWNSWFKSCTYLMDFLSIWIVFVISLVILRLFSDKICRVKVRFLGLANQIGSVVFACLVALAMLCFTTFTLHTAPLSQNFMYGAFHAKPGVIWGWAPDQWWLYFARSVSHGTYSRAKENRFDRYNQFTINYDARRKEIEEHVAKKHSIRKN